MSNSYIGNPPPSANQIQVLERDSRNVIINGNFNVWQRGITFPAIGASFCADRWRHTRVGVILSTVNRSTDVPTYAESGIFSTYSLEVVNTTALPTIGTGDLELMQYRVEGYDFAQLQGGDATLSFWVKGAVAGIHCVGIRNGSSDRTYISEYTIAVANTWERVEITVPFTETGGTWDYTDDIGIEINFVLASGSASENTPNVWHATNDFSTSNQVNEIGTVGNKFKLSQVQLERGNSATKFELIPHATDVTKCQRYYEQIEDNVTMCNCAYYLVDAAYGVLTFDPKRVKPTVIGSVDIRVNGFTFTHTPSFTLVGGTSRARASMTSLANPQAKGDAGWIEANGVITIDAEL